MRDDFESALDAFEDRLSQGKYRVQPTAKFDSKESGPPAEVPGTAVADLSAARKSTSTRSPTNVDKGQSVKVRKVRQRSRPKKSISPPRRASMGTVKEDEAIVKPTFMPASQPHNEDANASFLSAQSNLLDVTASSISERPAEPSTRDNARQASTIAMTREQNLGPSIETIPKVEPPPTMQTPPSPDKPQPQQEPPSKIPDFAKNEPAKKSVQAPPNSAPALLVSTKSDKTRGSPQREAPSSDKSKCALF